MVQRKSGRTGFSIRYYGEDIRASWESKKDTDLSARELAGHLRSIADRIEKFATEDTKSSAALKA